MKPGLFIPMFAALAKVDEKTLAIHARELRAAKVLPTHGRGNSGIEVDVNYLATLLIARMATDKPARAVEAFARVSRFQLAYDDMGRWVPQLAKGHTLFDFMSLICDPSLVTGALAEFTVTFFGVGFVEVRGGSDTPPMVYLDRSESDNLSSEGLDFEAVWFSPLSLHGIVEQRSFAFHWLQGLKSFVFAHGTVQT